MIPKVIHYCWFGRNPKPDLAIRCMESWKKYCPDWEIKEWNEDNFDVSLHPFLKAAYEAKKWAFVVDYVRLWIVYNHGGVYLDTDVELCKSLDDQVSYDCFISFESLIYLNLGNGFGAGKEHPYIQHLLESYDSIQFDAEHLPVSPRVNTPTVLEACPELERNGDKTQIIDNNIFYSVSDYYSFANHWCMMSWVKGVQDPSVRKRRKKSKFSLALQKWLKDSRKTGFIERHFGEKALRVYIFFAYDFFDSGIKYYVKRIFSRLKRK